MRHLPLRFLSSLAIPGILLLGDPAGAVQFRTVPIVANDVIYNTADGMLYVSVPGSAPLHPNTITRVDPVSLTLGPSIPIGSEPRKLALSDDGSVLWVGLDGAGAIRALDLSTFTPGPQHSLGNDPFTGPLFAEDLEVLPGSRTAVAVTLRNQGYSPRHEGVAVFDDGIPRTNVTPGHTGSNIIVFGSSAARLYGQNIESTEFGFRRMNVDAAGVTVFDVTQNLLNGFGGDIFFQAGRVYSTGGEVIDPEARTLLGRFPFPDFSQGAAMVPGGNRAYFAVSSFFGSPLRIRAYDTGTFTLLFDYGVPGSHQESATALRRWGADGLALRTSSGTVVVMSDVSSPPHCDLSLSLQCHPDPAAVDDYVSQRITIVNQGEAPAEQVVVRSAVPSRMAFYSATNPRGFCYDSLGTVVCTGGTLAAGGSFAIDVSLRANVVGTALHQATALSSTLDGDPSNNSASLTTQIQPRGSNACDFYVTFLVAPPQRLVEGQSFDHTIEFGNHGPNESQARLLGSVYGSDVDVEVLSGPAGCTPNPYGTLDCSLGLVPDGSSATMTLRVHARSPGYVATNYFVSTRETDSDYSNNNVGMFTSVVPSASRLIGELRTTIGELDLNPGERNVLDRKLASAITALAVPDTASACNDLNAFLNWMTRWTGRALDLDQAYALTIECRMIQELLDCTMSSAVSSFTTPEDGGGGLVPDGSPVSVLADPNAALLETERLDPATGVPTVLGLRVGGILGKPAILMPSAARARLELIDIQGRLVRTIFDGELPAGTHAMPVDLRQLPSGVYLYRLSSLGRQTLAKVTVLR